MSLRRRRDEEEKSWRGQNTLDSVQRSDVVDAGKRGLGLRWRPAEVTLPQATTALTMCEASGFSIEPPTELLIPKHLTAALKLPDQPPRKLLNIPRKSFMIVTTLRNSFLRPAVCLMRCRPCVHPRRSFSSFNSTLCPTAPISSPTSSVLGSLTGELDRLAPRFEIQANQIRIIKTPGEFYSVLKVIG